MIEIIWPHACVLTYFGEHMNREVIMGLYQLQYKINVDFTKKKVKLKLHSPVPPFCDLSVFLVSKVSLSEKIHEFKCFKVVPALRSLFFDLSRDL